MQVSGKKINNIPRDLTTQYSIQSMFTNDVLIYLFINMTLYYPIYKIII